MGLVASREEIVEIRAKARSIGKKVGFTSGVFDILHPGHVHYLEQARGLCDLLIVGVNGDSSVKSYKDPRRPINDELQRAKVVAALRCVDYVFIFSERSNRENIQAITPDLYIKAGDYSKEQLTSASLVESYGGKVVLIPVVEDTSTTDIISKITALYSEPASNELPLPSPAPAVFLDRDGTIIEHVEFIHEPEKVRPIPGAIAAMKKLKDSGYRLVVITNQPGIGLGYFTKEDFFIVNRELLKRCAKEGVSFDKVYFCPHSEMQKCTCRKPQTGMIDRAVQELQILLDKSYVIGDMTLDVQLGKNAGCSTIQVKTGIGGGDKRFEVTPDYVAENLTDAAEFILSSNRSGHKNN